MDTTFCQKRIISHASLATTLILYLVVWSSWANTAQGWLVTAKSLPRGSPGCALWLLWHRWRGRALLDFPGSTASPPSPGLWRFCPWGVTAEHSSSSLQHEHWSLMFPFPASTFPWLTAPPAHFPCSFTPCTHSFHPPVLGARTPCQRVRTTHLGSFLLLPYQQAHYLCKEKKKFNWCDTLHCWQAHTK